MESLNVVDDDTIKTTRAKAKASPRRRANYCLHQPDDYLQRMLQVGFRGTYWPPHQHPDKLEFFVILSGEMAVLLLDGEGNVTDVSVLGRGAVMAEVPPGNWHSVIILSDEASFIEIIEGHYDPASHKHFAEWAPAEDAPEAARYLDDLTKKTLNFIKEHHG